VDVQVLGRLQAARADQQIYLPSGRKPRLALAVLLARAERTVSTDALVAALWGDRPPASARRNLQQYVHQLRSALGSERLQGRPDGYAIVVGDGLDAARFRTSVAEGTRRSTRATSRRRPGCCARRWIYGRVLPSRSSPTAR